MAFSVNSSPSAWEGVPWSPLPPLEHDATADCCVVGLGGTGLTCIAEALDRGVASVIGIDAHDVGAGAAGRNGGLLLAGTADFHHDAVARLGRARAVELAQRTQREIVRFADEFPELVHVTGSLRIAASEDEIADCETQYRQMLDDGLPVEWYDGPEGIGLLFPGDGVFQPLQRCRVAAERVIAGGAQLFGGTAAVRVESGAVHTTFGVIRAKRIIVCVDGRLEALIPELRGEVRTARLQMLATEPTPDVSFPRPVYARYGYDYWQQRPDGRILLGGGRDITPTTEWTMDASPSAMVQAYLTRTLRERLGVTTASVTHRWGASVSYTETGLPVARRLCDGVWVIGGFSGTGNVMGAVCARDIVAAACA